MYDTEKRVSLCKSWNRDWEGFRFDSTTNALFTSTSPSKKRKSNFTNPADCKALNGSMINLLHWKLICLLFCFRRFFPRHTRWYPSWWKKANGLENLSNGLQGRLFRQVIIHMINNFHYWKIHSTSTSVLKFFETFVLILKVEHASEFRLWQGLQWTNLLVQNPVQLCFSAEFCREKIMNAR